MRPIALLTAALLAGCSTVTPDPLIAPPSDAAAPQAAAAAPAPVPARNAELAAFFDNYDRASLALSPLSKAYRGIKDADYG